MDKYLLMRTNYYSWLYEIENDIHYFLIKKRGEQKLNLFIENVGWMIENFHWQFLEYSFGFLWKTHNENYFICLKTYNI